MEFLELVSRIHGKGSPSLLVPSGLLDRFNSCCFSHCSLDSRSCFVSAQAPGGAHQALGSLQQWLLCSVQGEQAACSASTLALVRRGSKQQGGEQSGRSQVRSSSSRPALGGAEHTAQQQHAAARW